MTESEHFAQMLGEFFAGGARTMTIDDHGVCYSVSMPTPEGEATNLAKVTFLALAAGTLADGDVPAHVAESLGHVRKELLKIIAQAEMALAKTGHRR